MGDVDHIDAGTHGVTTHKVPIYYDSPREKKPDSFLKRGTDIEVNGLDPIDGHIWVNTDTTSGYIPMNDVEIDIDEAYQPNRKRRRTSSGSAGSGPSSARVSAYQPGDRGFILWNDSPRAFTEHITPGF